MAGLTASDWLPPLGVDLTNDRYPTKLMLVHMRIGLR